MQLVVPIPTLRCQTGQLSSCGHTAAPCAPDLDDRHTTRQLRDALAQLLGIIHCRNAARPLIMDRSECEAVKWPTATYPAMQIPPHNLGHQPVSNLFS